MGEVEISKIEQVLDEKVRPNLAQHGGDIEIEKLEVSETQNEKQMKEDRKSRMVKNVIDVGSIVLPLVVTIWGVKASLYCEDKNTVTTTVGRKFMDRIFSFKR